MKVLHLTLCHQLSTDPSFVQSILSVCVCTYVRTYITVLRWFLSVPAAVKHRLPDWNLLMKMIAVFLVSLSSIHLLSLLESEH